MMYRKLIIICDRIMFWLFYKRYYRKIFGFYGNDIFWGRDFYRKIIPSSVRISRPDKIYIGHNCKLDDSIYLQCHDDGDGIVIGNGTRINAHTHILSFSKITIGDQVLIAPFSLISSGNHGYKHQGIPIMNQPHCKSGAIHINNGVWVAHGAKILGNTNIGCNSVVAAGALVKGNFADNHIIFDKRNGSRAIKWQN